jgi:hypothetical protein
MRMNLVTPKDFDYYRIYYLSGPMFGYAAHNWPAFRQAAEILRQAGVEVISPIEINPSAAEEASKDPGTYKVQFLKQDLKSLLLCNGIILLKGWPKSRGARLELDVALELEFAVCYYDEARLVAMQ